MCGGLKFRKSDGQCFPRCSRTIAHISVLTEEIAHKYFQEETRKQLLYKIKRATIEDFPIAVLRKIVAVIDDYDTGDTSSEPHVDNLMNTTFSSKDAVVSK
jgi:hypothetical protein